MPDTLEYVIGSRVRCAGEECGELEFVVVDPVADKLTHLVVRPDAESEPRLVPAHLAVPGPDGVELNCTRARFDEFEPAVQTFFQPGAELTGLTGLPGPQPATTTVERLPVGEVSVRRGERVHAVDGEIGRVRGLIVVPPNSEVSHVLLDEGHLWGRKRVAIPIRDVTGIDADGVAVRLAKDEIKDLPPVDVDGL
ncbi:hypothetical protein [Catenulispora rubra]|uniref:hypothetical protein n=1 Tax=Catenulispora rubra TaxID=280293 RepID=UPI0018926DE7|nr:hypothetical protein [Catenulispora rubra]